MIQQMNKPNKSEKSQRAAGALAGTLGLPAQWSRLSAATYSDQDELCLFAFFSIP